MKITHVRKAKLSQPFAYSRAWYATRMAMIVEIETDDGVVGWGECYGPAWMTAAVVKSVSPLLVGADPLQTDWLWQEVPPLRDHGQKGVVVIQGLSGIDIALWDIKGKHFGVRAYRLMGGPLRTEVRAYTTGLYRRASGDPVQYLAEEAAEYVKDGFGAVKLKVGFGVEEDARVTRAVREAVGSDVALMVDANQGYDAVAAIRLGRMIEALDIGWFEEPVPPEDLAGYRDVKAGISIPIAGGECEFTRFGFPRSACVSGGGHRAARHVRRGRLVGVQEDRRYGLEFWCALQSPRMGNRHRDRRVASAVGCSAASYTPFA